MRRRFHQRLHPLFPAFRKVLLAGFLWALFTSASQGLAADPRESAVNLVTAIQDVAKQNIPAVVHIEVTERQQVSSPFMPFENDPFFRYFFGNPRIPRESERELVGLGTGMLIDAEGHILTNNHVVGGANKIEVQLSDGRKYTEKNVKLIGTDPKTDLAVVKITSRESFPHIAFGDSDKVEVGQWVVAIGHPRGLDETVTQGIISAKNRRGITDPNSYQDFLQTDAPINPGNSGGPLLNLRGEVIGVNAAIMSQSGGFEGIGFAIPSNMATHVAKQLIAHGRVKRGWMGASLQDLTPELAKSLRLDGSKGALVADVVRGGPAAAAGLERGDVVIAYRGQDTLDSAALRTQVANTEIGENASMTVMRNGNRRTLTITIGSQKEETQMLSSSLKERFGLSVRALTPREIEGLGLEEGQGVAVSEVSAKGPFGKAGFQVGDIILEVNGQPIDSPETLSTVLSAVPSRERAVVAVIDRSTGQSGYVRVPMP